MPLEYAIRDSQESDGSGAPRPDADSADESGPRKRFDSWPAPPERRPLDRDSEWGSLVADLSNGPSEPSWRVHDRTHLEFAVRYPVESQTKMAVHEWEAYFFVPESLRLDSTTYSKSDMYADLQSYVRFAVPEVRFSELADAPLEALSRVMHDSDPERVTSELRLFACAVRAAAVAQQRSIVEALDDPARRATGLAGVADMLEDAARLTAGLREELRSHPGADDTRKTAARWVDEDVSRLLEMIFGRFSVKLRKNAPASLQRATVAAAVGEARYRQQHGMGGVGRADANKRDAEHLEFRRHVLKRFTSSVLWLTPEVRQGARIVLQVLYAIAAGVAMAFAVTAALWNGAPQANANTLWMWSAIAIVAYMGKDRIKALLQAGFSKLVSKHFPDRRWNIRGGRRKRLLGKVDEVTGFVDFHSLPEPVLAQRRSTRRHPLEELSRPEKVLWHRKAVRLDPRQVAQVDTRFDALTEIFRLDLRRWLAHTDDPKRRILFAVPETEQIVSATAPRVYNIGVVYRLKTGAEDTPWQRIRVVVSRKGIRRIDPIDAPV